MKTQTSTFDYGCVVELALADTALPRYGLVPMPTASGSLGFRSDG